MNLNEFARQITLKEGKKISLPIAQVKEVLRLILRELKTLTLQELMEILKRQK